MSIHRATSSTTQSEMGQQADRCSSISTQVINHWTRSDGNNDWGTDLRGTSLACALPRPSNASGLQQHSFFRPEPQHEPSSVVHVIRPNDNQRSRTVTPPPHLDSKETVMAILKLAEQMKENESLKAIEDGTKSPAHQRLRARQDPEKKMWVEKIEETDVLCERGSRSNHHVGNKKYLQKAVKLRNECPLKAKDAKMKRSLKLVDWVKDRGGRFIQKDKSSGKWFIISDEAARQKASQALRESLTPEEREAKKKEKEKKGSHTP